jgi:serine/threonine protein kinase
MPTIRGPRACNCPETVHAAGVVRRDVKPANPLFGDDERLVLVYFGIVETSGDSPVHLPPPMVR